MKKIYLCLALILILLLTPASVEAEAVFADSAKIFYIKAKDSQVSRIARKKLAMSKILRQNNSPLLASVDSFLTVCLSYDLDCYLLPSISGLESSFGKFIHPGSNNPFGWGGGYIMFDNWDQAINTVGKGLRENYINKGADSVEKIAPIYAASKTWAPRVQYFMNVFENEEKKIISILDENQVNL